MLALVLLLPLGAALATGGRVQRGIALALALGALPAPWFAPAWPLGRAVLALTTIWGAARVFELASQPAGWPLGRRLFHALAFIDTRRLVARPPCLSRAHVVRALAFVPPLLAGAALAVLAGRASGPAHWALRWGGGLVAAYALTEVVYAGIWASYRAVGQVLPELHRDPVLSRSVGELWGQRWNTTVGSWLSAHCFRPLARRRWPLLGLCAAFAASALLHTYFALVPLGPRPAAWAAAYFAVQLGLVLAERPLGVARWRPAAAHAWVLTVMIASSPLMVEPLLRIAGA